MASQKVSILSNQKSLQSNPQDEANPPQDITKQKNATFLWHFSFILKILSASLLLHKRLKIKTAFPVHARGRNTALACSTIYRASFSASFGASLSVSFSVLFSTSFNTSLSLIPKSRGSFSCILPHSTLQQKLKLVFVRPNNSFIVC